MDTIDKIKFLMNNEIRNDVLWELNFFEHERDSYKQICVDSAKYLEIFHTFKKNPIFGYNFTKIVHIIITGNIGYFVINQLKNMEHCYIHHELIIKNEHQINHLYQFNHIVCNLIANKLVKGDWKIFSETEYTIISQMGQYSLEINNNYSWNLYLNGNRIKKGDYLFEDNEVKLFNIKNT